MPKTPMQGGSCVSAMWKCHYYNVILSEYRTKEITYAPLGLITVQCATAEQPEYRSAHIRGTGLCKLPLLHTILLYAHRSEPHLLNVKQSTKVSLAGDLPICAIVAPIQRKGVELFLKIYQFKINHA